MSAPDRRAMVERPGVDLSVRRQCTLLNLARSGVYRPKPVIDADDLAVMRRIDELHLELPFYGSRRMTFELNKEGRGVNRKRVQRLMRVMGIGLASEKWRVPCRQKGTRMIQQRRFTKEFQEEAVRLVQTSGRTQREIAADLGIGQSTLVRWLGQNRDRRAAAPSEGQNDVTAELKRLRRENEILRQERDILKKATAFFAREGNR